VDIDVVRERLEQTAPLLARYILPAFNQLFQRRTRLRQGKLVTLIRIMVRQFSRQHRDFVSQGFVACFSTLNHFGVIQRRQAGNQVVLRPLRLANTGFYPASFHPFTVLHTVQCLLPGIFVNGGGFQSFQ